MELDQLVLSVINHFAANSPLVLPLAVVAAVPLIWVLIAWYVIAFVWHKRGGVRELMALLAGVCAAYLVSAAIAQLWFRLRPYTVGASTLLISEPSALKSFPSDHATAAFFVAVLLTTHRRSWWWSLLIAALVALGRVAVGVHYPTDILAGALLGTTFGLATMWLEDRFTKATAR